MNLIPALPVYKAADRLAAAYAEIGAGPTYDRIALAQALGYSNPQSGRFSALLTSLQLYGFISRQASRYKFTPLFTAYYTAPDSREGRSALAKAAVLPPPFKALYDAFAGSRLPGDPARWLQHRFHDDLTPGQAAAAATLFVENLAAAGILRDGLLLDRSVDATPAGIVTTLPPAGAPAMPGPPAARAVTGNLPVSSFEKDFGGGRIAKVSVPADLTQEERDTLMALIQYL